MVKHILFCIPMTDNTIIFMQDQSGIKEEESRRFSCTTSSPLAQEESVYGQRLAIYLNQLQSLIYNSTSFNLACLFTPFTTSLPLARKSLFTDNE